MKTLTATLLISLTMGAVNIAAAAEPYKQRSHVYGLQKQASAGQAAHTRQAICALDQTVASRPLGFKQRNSLESQNITTYDYSDLRIADRTTHRGEQC